MIRAADEFHAGKLQSTRSISIAKRAIPTFGQHYGLLSEHFVHINRAHAGLEPIVRYEEGMNLVKVCQERLARAEQKIEIIARNSAGKTIVKDFEPTPEPAAPTEDVDESESTNDEIKLF